MHGTGEQKMYDELILKLREDAEFLKIQSRYNNIKNEFAERISQAADAIEELVKKEKFHTFLWNVINPNEMEQYIKMYNSKGIPVCGFPESPKEER